MSKCFERKNERTKESKRKKHKKYFTCEYKNNLTVPRGLPMKKDKSKQKKCKQTLYKKDLTAKIYKKKSLLCFQNYLIVNPIVK